jgi:hypothetical protein
VRAPDLRIAMFSATYTDLVTIRRPKKTGLGVTGRPEFGALVNADDETAIVVRCRIEERGRLTVDARQAQIRTDATLLYTPEGDARIQDGDFIVRGQGVYQVVGIELVRAPWGGGFYGRVDLVKSSLDVFGGVS